MNENFTRNDLIQILIKKASGYFYSEEQFEYETQKISKNNEKYINNLSFFENYDTVETNLNNMNDKIELSNEIKNSKEENRNLQLVKKKVATHYIAPDINAIKILFEIFEKKVGENSLENLTDEELLDLKNKLIKELSNEYNEN